MEQQTTGRFALRACIGILTAGVAASAAPAFADAPIVRVEKPIAGQYIVVFEEGSNVPAMMQKMATWSGATPMLEYGMVLTGGAFKMTESEARLGAKMPGVVSIEEDSVVELAAVNETAPLNYAIDQLTPGPGYVAPFSGKGVTIYIVDTGASKSQQGAGYDTARVVADLIPADNQQGGDCNGHGTAVSGSALGTRVGVAPDANLAVSRIFSCTGGTSNSIVIGGLDAVGRDFMARGQQPSVANGSFSGGASPASDAAANRLVDLGVTVVIAAGNDNKDACLNSPARAAKVLTVGANDRAFARSSFSNFGPCVEVFAAGTAITSLQNPVGMRTISGTSFASPEVAGVAAVIMEKMISQGVKPTPAAVRAELLRLARPNAISGANGPNALAQVPLN